VIHLVFFALAALLGGGATVITSVLIGAALSADIRDWVARWLREHGLSQSMLLSAVVTLDRVVGSIKQTVKASIQVTAKQSAVTAGRAETHHFVREYGFDQVTDPQVRALLENRGQAKQNVLKIIATT
jgi:hypothetical protein